MSGGNPPTCHKEDDRLVTHHGGVVLNHTLVGAIVQDFHGGDPQGEVPGVHLRPVPVPLVVPDPNPIGVGQHHFCDVLLPVHTVLVQAL